MTYPFADKPDLDMARAALEGDDAARDRLIDTYKDVLFTCVLRLTGDAERAESALVHGLSGWFHDVRRVLASHGVRGSLYRMALREARKASKEVRPDAMQSPKAVAEQSAELTASGATVEPFDRSSQLQWVLMTLPFRSRELLVLIDVMGMTDEQAAFVLGMRPSDLPGALARAARDLLDAYEKYGPPHPPSSVIQESKLRSDLRAMGWGPAPWHLSSSVRQALLQDRGRGRRRTTVAVVALILLAVLVILWVLL